MDYHVSIRTPADFDCRESHSSEVIDMNACALSRWDYHEWSSSLEGPHDAAERDLLDFLVKSSISA
jgi:hypothetical protein